MKSYNYQEQVFFATLSHLLHSSANNPPDGMKPNQQRLCGFMKYCSIGYCCFCMAINTLKSSFALFPRADRTTNWTYKAMWPSNLCQIVNTILVCLKHLFKFHLISRIIHSIKIILYGRRLHTPFNLLFFN